MSTEAPNPANAQPPAGAHASRLRAVGGFDLLDKLGQGGMGAVFKARQKSLDRIVAVKVLPPSIAKNAKFIERFQREARASAKFNHPNIVQGIDVGQDQASGLWYFAMEYVDGPSLKQVLAEQKVLPESRGLAIVREIAKALECVAANGMVHRDIKPDNILLTKRGEAKLADLGLAKQLHDDAGITQSGQSVGTPHYMAPEQARGKLAEIDIRTDIYALGGTLFHLVTGRTPYVGDTSPVIMMQHLMEPPPKAREVNPQVSEGCSRLIEWMMQKDKAERIQTPTELVRLIDKVLRKEHIAGPRTAAAPAPPAPPAAPEERGAAGGMRARKGLLIGAAAGLAVAVLFFVVRGIRGRDAPLATAGGKKGVPQKTEGAAPSSKTVPPSQTKPGPRTEPPVAKPPPKKDGPQEMFRAVQEWEKSHPDACDEALGRYHKLTQAVKAASDPQLEDALEDAIAAVETRRAKAAETTWQALEAKVKTCAAAGDYDAALAACEALPAPLAKLLQAKASEKARALHQEAETRIGAAVAKIEECSANAEPAEGQKILAELERISYAPTKGIIAALKTRLQDELANVGELRKKRELRIAQKRLDDLLQRFDKAVLDAGNLPAAKDVAAEARRDSALAPLEAQAHAMGEVAAAFDELARLSEESLHRLRGQKLELETKAGKTSGTVDRVQDGTVFVTLAGEGAVAVKPVKVAELVNAEQRRLFSGAVTPQTNAQRTALALTRLAKDKADLKAAGELLAQALAFPLASHYQALVEKRQAEAAQAAAEAKATALWAELEFRSASAKLGENEAKVLLAKVQRFEKEYGSTQFAASVQDKLAALKERVENAGGANLLKNGSFETGTLEGWFLRSPPDQGHCEVVKTDAHDGKAAALVSTSGRSALIQNLTLEPGVSYRFSAWCRLVKGEAENAASRVMVIDGERPSVVIHGFVETLRTKDWKRIEGVVTPASAKVQLMIALRPSTPVEFLLDDVRLTAQPKAASAPKETLVPSPKPPPVRVP